MEFPVILSEKFLEKARRLHIFVEDIEEKFIRGSGSGGQKINKTASAVWLKHLPTGIEVKNQEFRERETNRLRAYSQLILKIETRVLGKQSQEAQRLFKLRKQKKRRSRRAKEKILEAKAHRAELKKQRAEPRVY